MRTVVYRTAGALLCILAGASSVHASLNPAAAQRRVLSALQKNSSGGVGIDWNVRLQPVRNGLERWSASRQFAKWDPSRPRSTAFEMASGKINLQSGKVEFTKRPHR